MNMNTMLVPRSGWHITSATIDKTISSADVTLADPQLVAAEQPGEDQDQPDLGELARLKVHHPQADPALRPPVCGAAVADEQHQHQRDHHRNIEPQPVVGFQPPVDPAKKVERHKREARGICF
jgi:hypothetical protein